MRGHDVGMRDLPYGVYASLALTRSRAPSLALALSIALSCARPLSLSLAHSLSLARSRYDVCVFVLYAHAYMQTDMLSLSRARALSLSRPPRLPLPFPIARALSQDALKAGMQLRGGVQSGATQTTIPLLQRVGLLYYGLRAALFRTIPYTGMRMMIYGVFKSMLSSGGGDHSALALTAMAMTAGITSQLLVSPMDLFKIRMQGDAARVRRGERPVYSSLWHLMSSVARKEGVRGMWTGCKINAIRAALMNVADQAVTDVVRRALGPGVLAQLAVSAVTGVSVVLLTCPADTVRSKLMNFGPSSPQPQFSGITDTVTKTWRQSGLRGFYSAMVPMYLREGPYYFVLWNALAGLRHLRAVAIGS